ncbi:MAG TPA: mechanosensitive ion channel family protein, partial [Candidatus Berkiella sp.]|nr:mechanosensitive ion channel family protein [Candidatus Berkiella sp.]
DFNDALLDLTSSQALAQAIQIFILITAGLIILKYFFNLSFTGLWAIGGIGSFVIGWAAKDLLANFFGAIMIYFDRPFSIGDWIRSPDREIEGIVEYIGWRLTKIRTFDKRPLYIPNSLFATICIENVSQTSYQRIKESIAISFKDIDQLESIMLDIKEMLEHHHDVDTSMNCSVNLTGINKSSLNISMVCFVKMV